MTPLNLGVRGHDIAADSPWELSEKVGRLGLTNVQLAVRKSFPQLAPLAGSLSPGAAAAIGGAFSSRGIGISVLGCYVNISSDDAAIRSRALDDFRVHLRLCRNFGAALVGTETGSVKGGWCRENFTEEAYRTARDSVARLVEYAEGFGATVGIEPGQNHPIYDARRMKRLLEDIRSDHLAVILDCANLLTAENFGDQRRVYEQALEELGEHVAHLHLKDCEPREGGVRVVPVGMGRVDFSPILRFAGHERPLMSMTFEATGEERLPQAIERILQCCQGG